LTDAAKTRAAKSTAMTKSLIIKLTVIIITTISLSACSQTTNDAHAVVYNTSVDVPLQHWTSADTLFYPIVIDEQPSFQFPVCAGKDYHVRFCIRYSIDFPLSKLPANLYVQEMDNTDDRMRIKRRLRHLHIEPNIKDSQGRTLGGGWGSLYENQEVLPDQVVSFDRPGIYRLLIIPAFNGMPEGINGIASIGIELFE